MPQLTCRNPHCWVSEIRLMKNRFVSLRRNKFIGYTGRFGATFSVYTHRIPSSCHAVTLSPRYHGNRHVNSVLIISQYISRLSLISPNPNYHMNNTDVARLAACEVVGNFTLGFLKIHCVKYVSGTIPNLAYIGHRVHFESMLWLMLRVCVCVCFSPPNHFS